MKYLLLVSTVLALAACQNSHTYPELLDTQAQKAATTEKTPVDQIRLIPGDSANNGNFVILEAIDASVGKISAFHPTPTVAQAEQKLRIEAAKLGADAVINTSISEVTICAFSWGCRKMTGTAVRFSDS
ncbi:MAG: YbjQ family protein [Rhodobacteraceae bacterium]|nr:YbjQ family protein [Paracoccaceae bacterium]